MAEIENKNDSFWLWLGVAIFIASIIAFYSLEQTAFIRTIIVLLGFAAGVFLALQSQTGKKAWFFVQETRIELKKVVWPARAETIRITIMVIIGVIIIALFLWMIDSILLWFVQYLI